MPKIKDVFEKYIDQYSAPRGNEAQDRQAAKRALVAFGNKDAVKITVDDVTDWMGKQTLKPATVNRYITPIQAAINWSKLRPDPFIVPRLKEDPPKDLWLNETQERMILEALPMQPIDLRLYVRMGLAYGVRSGAMLDLTFGPQVNFKTKTIDFNVPGRRLTKKRRPASAPMTPEIYVDLLHARKDLRWNNKVLDGQNTVKKFTELMKSLDLEWCTPHVLKHTATSLMIRGGANPDLVARITATDIKTIRKVYMHHDSTELMEAITTRRAS